MKTLVEINTLLSAFEETFGLKLRDAQQGSEAWFNAKLGVLSASRASEIVAKKGTATRLNYMAELVAQVCTGIPEEINAKALDWGNQHEDAARSSYEFSQNVLLTQVPFVFKDMTFREGCSPDGLIDTVKGTEIKCPFATENYIKFLIGDAMKSEWQWQNQFTLRVVGADEWDVVQFDPRMTQKPMHIVTVKRDAEKQAILDDAVPAFIEDMDAMLAKIGVKFGDQWLRIAQQQARVAQAG